MIAQIITHLNSVIFDLSVIGLMKYVLLSAVLLCSAIAIAFIDPLEKLLQSVSSKFMQRYKVYIFIINFCYLATDIATRLISF